MSKAPGSIFGRLAAWSHRNLPTRESMERNRLLRPVAHRVLAPERVTQVFLMQFRRGVDVARRGWRLLGDRLGFVGRDVLGVDVLVGHDVLVDGLLIRFVRFVAVIGLRILR